MSTKDWWDDFFSGPWSRIQAGGYPPERTAEDCNLIEGALALKPGARVLDIPCGIGRHSVELARRGFDVTGVELKAEHVEQAKESAARAGVAPRFVIGDMFWAGSADDRVRVLKAFRMGAPRAFIVAEKTGLSWRSQWERSGHP